MASASSHVRCKSEFGSKVPVLMVHGFNSNADIWRGSGSLSEVLQDIDGIDPVYFDYSAVHSQWVTNQAIGPSLANTIDCLAQTSLKNGGKGKVIVIGHSMGGLATRYAASQTVDGRKVADQIGLVITLGTPHKGSSLGNIGTQTATFVCRSAVANFVPILSIFVSADDCLANLALKGLGVGSKELQALPPFPANIPVRAIAGNTRIFVQLFYTDIVKEGTSDLVVGVDSATAEFTDTRKGDGKFEFSCDLRRYGQGVNTSLQGGQCSHNGMYKTGYVQESVKQGVEEYLSSTTRPPVPTGRIVTLFNKLTMTYLNVWEGAQSIPGQVENIVDHSLCKDIAAKCPHIFIANLDSDYGMTTYGDDPLATIAQTGCTQSTTTAPSPLQLVETFDIDGVATDYYIQNCSAGQSGVEVVHYWYVANRDVLVTTKRTSADEVSLDNLRAVLRNATWQ